MYRFFMTARASMAVKLLGLLFAAFILIFIGLFFFVSSAPFRTWVQAELSARSGLEVRLEKLAFQPPLGVIASAVQVSKPGEFLLKTDRLTLRFTPLDLWLKAVHRVAAERPVLEFDVEELIKPATTTSAKFALRQLNVQDGTIVLKKGGSTLFELPNINLEAQNLNLGERSGISLHADVPQLQAEMELNLSGALRALDGEIVLRSKQTKQIIRPSVSADSAPELLRLHAELHAPENQQAKTNIEGKFQNLTVGERRFTGNINARAAIDRGWTEARFTGDAVLINLADAIGPVAAKLPRGNASADFSGSFSLPNKTLILESITISSPFGKGAGEGVASFAAPPLMKNGKLHWSDVPLEALRPALPSPLNQWSFQGRGQVDLNLHGPLNALGVEGVARGDAAKFQAGNVSSANVNFALPFEWSSAGARFREAKIIATQLAYGGKDLWQWEAASVQLRASSGFLLKESAVKIGGAVETAGGKFTSPDNSKVGENLAIRGPFELTLLAGKNSASINGKFAAESGEILWNKFFNDLRSQKPALDLDGDYYRDQDRIDCRRCNITLANIGVIDITGSIERLTQTPLLRLQAHSKNFSPGGFFEYILRENLNRQFPLLNNLTIAGQLAFRSQLRGTAQDLSAEGELSLDAGELRAKSNEWEIGPVALNLPFRISTAQGQKTPTESTAIGTLTIENFRFGSQAAGLSSVRISLSDNAFRFHQPLRVSVFGGEVIVSNLLWPDVISRPKQLYFSVETKGLQLQELTQALGWPRFSGTLTGTIPEVQSSDNILRANGEIQAELFGGRMRMSKLEIENPFSPLASIKLDATLQNIQLQQLSKTFAFGQISGILEGNIADLIITDGQPAQFGADVHSVDRGGEQRISVEALNKITVLSSGQSAGALYGGLAGFFDSFRYSKLGFKAILRNDRLTLRGVETRGNEEYLVVGSLLPPTVNIISHTQTIAFSELVRRLERIKSDKPEIK
jgi:hypothetical protein